MQTNNLRIEVPFRRLVITAALIAGLSLTAMQAGAKDSVSNKDVTQDTVAPAVSLANKDWQALRVWFHQTQSNVSDGLNSYAENYQQTPKKTQALALR